MEFPFCWPGTKQQGRALDPFLPHWPLVYWVQYLSSCCDLSGPVTSDVSTWASFCWFWLTLGLAHVVTSCSSPIVQPQVRACDGVAGVTSLTLESGQLSFMAEDLIRSPPLQSVLQLRESQLSYLHMFSLRHSYFWRLLWIPDTMRAFCITYEENNFSLMKLIQISRGDRGFGPGASTRVNPLVPIMLSPNYKSSNKPAWRRWEPSVLLLTRILHPLRDGPLRFVILLSFFPCPWHLIGIHVLNSQSPLKKKLASLGGLPVVKMSNGLAFWET